MDDRAWRPRRGIPTRLTAQRNNASKIEKALIHCAENVGFWHAVKDKRREALHETIGCALALLALDERRRGEQVIEREQEAMERRRQEVR